MTARGALLLVAAAALAALAAAIPRARAAGAAPAIEAPGTVRQGELFLVRDTRAGAAPRSVEFRGQRYSPLAAGPGGPVFLLGVDLDAEPGTGELVVRGDGGTSVRTAVAVERGRFPEERLTLPPAMVTPPPEVEARIVREQALTASIYGSSAPAQLWSGGFAPPLDAPGSGNFGKRRILNGQPRSPHSGQDYAAAAGTPVRAVAGGRVRLAADLYFSGNTVLVDHGAGLVSQYLHLEKMLVAEGDEVAGGETVGLVGSTGRATGPHLHYGLRLHGQRVDPERIFRLLPRR